MANYEIPEYPTQRLRYFNNQFLNDQDFIDGDTAQLGHERALLRSLCVAGVCEGMQVTYPAPNLPPSVSAGIAVDPAGRMIVVDRATDALTGPDALANGDYFIHISFREIEDAQAAGQGASDFTRWMQAPVINATAKSAALPDGAVVLGSCTVQNNAFVGTGTTVGRQYSGLRLPGPNPSAAATLRNTGASDDLAVLAGSLTVRRDTAGQVGPKLTLQNSAGGTGAGGAIDFNGRDPGTNAPSLRIQSLDDGSFSSHLTFSTKTPGAVTNGLVERLRLTSDGLLKFPGEIKDKLLIYDNGTDRYGIGLNGANISLFCPTYAHFSLRQNSFSGTEVFSVSGSGAVTLSGPILNSLTIRRDVSGQLGPTLTLLNGSGGNNAGGAIDFNGRDPGTSAPALRIQSLDDGNFSSHLTFSTKAPGAATNPLVERLRLTSDGLLKFPAEAPKDKIVLWDNETNRFGIGVSSGNLNLFYPPAARFSLRQNSSNGTEVFKVDSNGAATFFGPIYSSNGTISLNGLLRFPNEIKDKILLWDGFGMGLNQYNLNLFYPPTARFSLRQNSYNGAEVFSVSGSGTLTVTNGSRFSGDRHYFTDSEGSNRLRVGTAWDVPGIYSEDNQDIVVGCSLGYSVFLGTKGAANEYVTVNDGQIWARGFHNSSDERLKENIEPIAGSLDKVVRLHGVSFDWKADDRLEGAPKHLGLVAQQVREIVPEAVVDGKEGSLSIAYNAITALLVEAIKEQQKHIDELRAALTPAPAH